MLARLHNPTVIQLSSECSSDIESRSFDSVPRPRGAANARQLADQAHVAQAAASVPVATHHHSFNPPLALDCRYQKTSATITEKIDCVTIPAILRRAEVDRDRRRRLIRLATAEDHIITTTSGASVQIDDPDANA